MCLTMGISDKMMAFNMRKIISTSQGLNAVWAFYEIYISSEVFHFHNGIKYSQMTYHVPHLYLW